MTPRQLKKLLEDRPDIRAEIGASVRSAVNGPVLSPEEARFRVLAALQEEDRPHKFNAQRVEVDGRWFASKAEARRWQALDLMEQGGLISNLECQPRFRIEVNGIHICDYVADFKYLENGEWKIEDVKGVRTAAYILKRKLMWAVWGVEVKETEA